MNIEQARFNMIEQQIRPWDVLNTEILALLGQIKREHFVPAAYKGFAFNDMEIPLGDASRGEIMLAPRVEARLLQELSLKKTDRVLEVGTGSGFMAALMAHRAQHVTSLEINPALAEHAQAKLQAEYISNVKIETADGASYSSEQRFDAIILSGSVAERPQALMDMLSIGGRMALIVGEEPIMRALLITRTSQTQFNEVTLFDTVAPRLHRFPESRKFVL
jgi:protein-L-isoaspartate(D-aspartate) O-methyltransferase